MKATLKNIRSTFLDYFEKNGHKILPASSLVPNNDPTLMFTNSGMVQFKNIFTGNETAAYTRAATSQKSVRAGGKHNDLDSVGYDVRHHTFFEMLGNFSFGDYFKDEAIAFAWELITKEFQIPAEKLAVTVFHTDEVARNIWKKVSGLPDERIIGIATKDNFWQMGDTGPCGYCSEIFYDHGPEVWGGLPGTPEGEGDRWIEIWNLVFDEFEDLPDGSRIELKQKCIDTGMGLERMSAILQGVHSNYQIDLFRNLIADIAKLAHSDPENPELVSSHNVIADHLRAMCFLIADGVLPSNEGRGYVLRRIMRRAMRHTQMLGVKEPMIYKLVPSLQREMGEAYPELNRANALITETIKNEETRFIKTLEKGLKILDEETSGMKNGDVLGAKTAFKLYDTYGFPIDLTQDALRNRGISVDMEGFDAEMEKQKAEARKNWGGSGDEGTEKIWFAMQEKFGHTEFLGYSTLKSDCLVNALVSGDKEQSKISSGEFCLISNQTPFYAEMGGQCGDKGKIYGYNCEVEVYDTKKKLDGVYVHYCRLIKGEISVGEVLTFEVDKNNRAAICANHSVTHLVHKALRTILGEHVTQKGSAVAADRMRFDISHPKQISREELREAERIVNDAIRKNYRVVTRLMSRDEAMNCGAMALFGEKYGDEVRVVSMEDEEGNPFSVELCGGTHVKSTGDIGYFQIVSEGAVGAGVRRIECLTGYAAEMYVDDIEDKLQRVSNTLKTNINDLEKRVVNLLEEKKKLEQEIFNMKKDFASDKAGDNCDKFQMVNGVKFVAKVLPNAAAKELKAFVDEIYNYLDEGIVALGSIKDDKASIVVGIKGLTNKYSAVDLVRLASPMVGGNGGGGRPDMAQAGGPDANKIGDAINAIRDAI